jgi:dipeptidyl aminopeptidase/acylaminoacyl peptidase
VHDVAPDGRLLLERYVGRYSVLFGVTGAGQEKDLGWLDGTQVRQISRDGKYILFDEVGEGEGTHRGVFIRPTDGGPAIRLGDGAPQMFSPDGKWVVAITETTPSEIVLLPIGPGSPRKIPSPGLNPVLVVQTGPNYAVLSSSPGEPLQSYAVDPEGRSKPRLADLPGINWDAHGELSPDGRLVAYSTTDRKILLSVDGGKPAPIPNATLAPGEYITIFSPDQRYLQTQTQSEIPARIYRTDLKTGEKTLWKEIEPADRSGVVWIDEVHFTPDLSAYAYTFNRLEDSDLYVVEGLR